MARNWSSGDIVTATNLGSIERGVNAVSSMYEPTTWENGDVFTAEKLNNIEQGIENASNLWTVLTEETVTTEASGSGLYGTSLEYSELITADSVRITLNGVEYTCANISEESGEGAYGAEIPNWSTYPFRLESSESPFGGVVNHITTETAGTYTIKIEAPQGGSSSDFSTATMTLNTNTECEITAPLYNGGFIMSKSVFRTSNEVPIVLAPQGTMILINTSGTISVSGNIQSAGGGYGVTGDCTITISDSSSEPAVK